VVTLAIAKMLLRIAARRWPAGSNREWTAELHVLAADRRHLAMLTFAASLALTRPAIPRTGRSLMNPRIWTDACALLLIPAACTVGLTVFYQQFVFARPAWASETVAPLVVLGSSLALGWLAHWLGRRSSLVRPAAIVAAVILACVTSVSAIGLMLLGGDNYVPFLGPVTLWALGLTLALAVSAVLTMSGRRLAAWTAGTAVGLIAIIAGDFAVAEFDPRYIGGLQEFLLLPFVGFNGQLLQICSAFALAYVVGAAKAVRQRSPQSQFSAS
jgi:hypothetical protein